jgi:hypothetical protein
LTGSLSEDDPQGSKDLSDTSGRNLTSHCKATGTPDDWRKNAVLGWQGRQEHQGGMIRRELT